jgi:hypothetical protein
MFRRLCMHSYYFLWREVLLSTYDENKRESKRYVECIRVGFSLVYINLSTVDDTNE